jgi:hypothetical protein
LSPLSIFEDQVLKVKKAVTPRVFYEATWFSTKGKSIELKCNMTVVDHITQIPVEYHIHTT